MTKDPRNDSFFLPESYRPNPVATTRDTERADVYWNTKRKKAAGAYQYPVYRYCMDVIRNRNMSSLTDIGCGYGTKLRVINDRFPELSISGVDQPSAIDECRRQFGFGKWYSDDLENPAIDFDRIKADLVVCADVIEHVTNPDAVLKYLANSTSENGLIVISTPDRERMYRKRSASPRNPDHVREWSATEFRDYLESRGFIIHEHFHVAPIKISFDRVSALELAAYVLYGRKFSFNQVCLLEPTSDTQQVLG